jgi:hypothetical protein
MATINTSIMQKSLRWFIHGLGLSSLASALFLQGTVFTNILQNGYFRGVEQNSAILYTEIALTGFAVAYFGYMLVKFILPKNYSNRKE